MTPSLLNTFLLIAYGSDLKKKFRFHYMFAFPIIIFEHIKYEDEPELLSNYFSNHDQLQSLNQQYHSLNHSSSSSPSSSSSKPPTGNVPFFLLKTKKANTTLSLSTIIDKWKNDFYTSHQNNANNNNEGGGNNEGKETIHMVLYHPPIMSVLLPSNQQDGQHETHFLLLLLAMIKHQNTSEWISHDDQSINLVFFRQTKDHHQIICSSSFVHPNNNVNIPAIDLQSFPSFYLHRVGEKCQRGN